MRDNPSAFLQTLEIGIFRTSAQFFAFVSFSPSTRAFLGMS